MKSLKSFLHDSRGFTLPEVLVSMGILTVVMSTIGIALFQALDTQTGIVDDGLAINELRKGFSWFAEDVKMARSADLVDGVPAPTVTLTWTDEFNDVGVDHTASYAGVGDRLVRTYDDNAHTVAHRVVSVAFTLSNRSITAQLEVEAEPGATRTLSVKGVMRSAP